MTVEASTVKNEGPQNTVTPTGPTGSPMITSVGSGGPRPLTLTMEIGGGGYQVDTSTDTNITLTRVKIGEPTSSGPSMNAITSDLCRTNT